MENVKISVATTTEKLTALVNAIDAATAAAKTANQKAILEAMEYTCGDINGTCAVTGKTGEVTIQDTSHLCHVRASADDYLKTLSVTSDTSVEIDSDEANDLGTLLATKVEATSRKSKISLAIR